MWTFASEHKEIAGMGVTLSTEKNGNKVKPLLLDVGHQAAQNWDP